MIGARLRDIDIYGHSVNVNYKGRDTYKTSIGGILTIATFIFTLIMSFKAIEELFVMHDPKLIEYTRKLTLDERIEMRPVSASDFDFIFGFSVLVTNKTSGEERYSIPTEVGTFVAATQKVEGEPVYTPLKNCKDLISDEVLKYSPPA